MNWIQRRNDAAIVITRNLVRWRRREEAALLCQSVVRAQLLVRRRIALVRRFARRFRIYVAEHKRRHASASLMASCFRGIGPRRRLRRARRAADTIRGLFKRYETRQLAAARLQGFARGIKDRKWIKARGNVCAVVQKNVRRWLQHRHYQDMKAATRVIQKGYRKHFVVRRSACVRIQQKFRGVIAAMRWEKLLRLRYRCAREIQKIARGYVQRQLLPWAKILKLVREKYRRERLKRINRRKNARVLVEARCVNGDRRPMVVTTRFRYPTRRDITVSLFVPDVCHECEIRFTRDTLPASVGGFDFWDALAREVDANEVGYRAEQRAELVEYKAREKRLEAASRAARAAEAKREEARRKRVAKLLAEEERRRAAERKIAAKKAAEEARAAGYTVVQSAAAEAAAAAAAERDAAAEAAEAEKKAAAKSKQQAELDAMLEKARKAADPSVITIDDLCPMRKRDFCEGVLTNAVRARIGELTRRVTWGDASVRKELFAVPAGATEYSPFAWDRPMPNARARFYHPGKQWTMHEEARRVAHRRRQEERRLAAGGKDRDDGPGMFGIQPAVRDVRRATHTTQERGRFVHAQGTLVEEWSTLSLKASKARTFKQLHHRYMHGVGYMHGGEFQIKLHDPGDCGEYRVNVPMHDVCRWLAVRDADSVFPKFLADTDAARARLLRWFMGTNGMLFMYAENVGGKGGTKLSVRCCHYEHVAAQTIIGCWNGMKAKLKMRAMIAGIWRKQLDPATRKFVYYNVNSREFKKDKPLCLGEADLEASARWEPRRDEKGRTYYVHLKTGRVSLYSTERAAVILQRRFRKRQAAYFQVPMGDLVKALKMQAQAELSYALDPTSLESRINYALYQHAVQHDYELARVLYQQALQDEDQRRHPLVHYSVALLLLADDSASAAQRGLRDVVEKANEMLERAHTIDHSHKVFDTAEESFFRWAMVVGPRNVRSLLNWALVQQLIYGRRQEARRFMRRAWLACRKGQTIPRSMTQGPFADAAAASREKAEERRRQRAEKEAHIAALEASGAVAAGSAAAFSAVPQKKRAKVKLTARERKAKKAEERRIREAAAIARALGEAVEEEKAVAADPVQALIDAADAAEAAARDALAAVDEAEGATEGQLARTAAKAAEKRAEEARVAAVAAKAAKLAAEKKAAEEKAADVPGSLWFRREDQVTLDEDLDWGQLTEPPLSTQIVCPRIGNVQLLTLCERVQYLLENVTVFRHKPLSDF